MKRKNVAAFVIAACAIVAIAGTAGRADAKSKPAPYAPHINPAEFQSTVDHPFFPLKPGTRFTYRETIDGKALTAESTVLSESKTVMGVHCVVVHDVLRDHDTVIEDTYDWYAQDLKGNVWYFGENTKEFMPHGRVVTEGSWEGGVGGGIPGIIMPAQLTAGAPYRQEYLRGHAEDMAQILAVNDSLTVPFGTFGGCLRTKEWSMLEAGGEKKWYVRGVGFARSESESGEVSVLISVKHP